MRTRVSSAAYTQTALPVRRGRRSERRRPASADAAARDARTPVVRKPRSWSRPVRGNGAQVIVARWKRSKRTAGFFRGDPHGLVALPTACKNVFGETRQEVCRESRLLQGEGVIGVWNDHQRTVGNVDAQG